MHDVNLFREDLRPPKHYFSLRNSMLGVAAFCLALSAISAGDAITIWRVSAERDQLQQGLDALAHSGAQLRAEMADHARHNERLEDSADVLRRNLLSKQALIALVEAEVEKAGTGFYGFLADLSDTHAQGIWLDRITVSDGGAMVALTGGTTSAAEVPRLLDRLAATEHFEDRRFTGLEISRADEEKLRSGVGVQFEVAGLRYDEGTPPLSEAEQNATQLAGGRF